MNHRQLAACGAALLLAAAGGTALAAPPHAFVKDAIQGDNAEVAMGRMAENRAARPAVRDYGRMLEQDHSMHKQEAMPLARRLGVRDTDGVPPDARATQRRLRGLRGPAFDNAFLRAMAKDHRKMIRMFDAQARGRGPDAQMARQTLPTLHHHLDEAERLMR